MVLESQVEQTSTLFAPYVDELRTIFSSHDLKFGSVDDLGLIAQLLSASGSLPNEVSAKVRSIIYREHESLTEADLLQLLLVSIGGAEAEADSPRLQEPIRHLLVFLGGALRSFWKSSPNGPYKSRLAKNSPKNQVSAKASAPARQDATALAEPRQNEQITSAQFIPDSSADDAHVAKNQEAVAAEVARMMERERLDRAGAQSVSFIEEIRVLDETERVPGTDRGSQNGTTTRVWDDTMAAHAPLPMITPLPVIAPLPVATLPEPAVPSPQVSSVPQLSASPRGISMHHHTASLPENEATQKEAEEDDAFPEYRSLHILRPEHRALWIVGICGVLLGLLIGILLHAHGAAEDLATPKIISPNQSALPSNPILRARPSPYGLPASSQGLGAAQHVEGYRKPGADQSGSEQADSGPGQGLPQLPVRVAGRATAQAPTARYSPEPYDGAGEGGSGPERAGASASQSRVVGRPTVSSSQTVFLSASGVMARNLVVAPAPAYPAAASASGVQGKVVVQVLVGRDGHVLDAHVISGDQLLREAALEAVSRWRYRPFLAGGKAAEIETTATLDFRLFR